MCKLKEWFYWFFLIGAHVWGWCGIIGYILTPLILGACVSPWWFLSWIVTVPAAIATMIVMDIEMRNK